MILKMSPFHQKMNVLLNFLFLKTVFYPQRNAIFLILPRNFINTVFSIIVLFSLNFLIILYAKNPGLILKKVTLLLKKNLQGHLIEEDELRDEE
jgi:hypothetical protein